MNTFDDNDFQVPYQKYLANSANGQGYGTVDNNNLPFNFGNLPKPSTDANLNFFERNSDTIGNVVSGLSMISNFLGAKKQNKLAREQLDFQKMGFNKNLQNNVQSYNTQLQDRANSRAEFSGNGADAQAKALSYFENNKLKA